MTLQGYTVEILSTTLNIVFVFNIFFESTIYYTRLWGSVAGRFSITMVDRCIVTFSSVPYYSSIYLDQHKVGANVPYLSYLDTAKGQGRQSKFGAQKLRTSWKKGGQAYARYYSKRMSHLTNPRLCPYRFQIHHGLFLLLFPFGRCLRPHNKRGRRNSFL